MASDRQERLSTGVRGLDREKQLGGIPAGSTVGVVVPPHSMAYLLGYHLFATGRETRYVSTDRRADDVEADLRRSLPDAVGEDPAIVGVRDDLDRIPGAVTDHLDGLGEGGNFVLDAATALTRGDEGFKTYGAYRETLRAIQTDTYDRGGLSYVFFVAPAVEHLAREEWELLHALDGAFLVSHEATARDVETYLHVHKLRDVAPAEEAFKLELDWRASVDASENIG